MDDIKSWAVEGVDGIVCDHAHIWPVLLEPDMRELTREDADGEYHWDKSDILDAVVVIPSSKRDLHQPVEKGLVKVISFSKRGAAVPRSGGGAALAFLSRPLWI